MILFFDTETTGFADFRMPPDHPTQPHLVQLACLLTEDDGTERGCLSLIVKPDGYEIPAKASDVHGITTEIACQVGVPMNMALASFRVLAGMTSLAVAHNLDFDTLVMEAQFARHQAAGRLAMPEKTYCTMRTATPICKVLHASPRHGGDWKWPKLEECIRHFFDEELTGAHDAMVDVRACARVYFALQALKGEAA